MERLLIERRSQVRVKGRDTHALACDRKSTAGSVSQRACAFCGSRVVLYPIADALHLVHGPAGCAAFTWDIRGALSSGPALHRLSFSTDLRERDIVFGGIPRLDSALRQLIPEHRPAAAFVYPTCVAGIIGDDVVGAARRATEEFGIPVIAVESEGFRSNKRGGYGAACRALLTLIGTSDEAAPANPFAINILGDYNLAGELWLIRGHLEEMGVEIVATMTGDGRVADLRRAHRAALNVVQCAGSMDQLARAMRDRHGIPFVKVSFFGPQDMSQALYAVAEHFESKELMERARAIVARELGRLMPALEPFRRRLQGRRAALYVGGAFKAISLISALRLLGMRAAVVGTQTGDAAEYAAIEDACEDGTVIVDDTNPMELAQFVRETDCDILIGGVKERPIAHKLGLGFVDHNHERKECLAGYDGMLQFARETEAAVLSPIFSMARRRGEEP